LRKYFTDLADETGVNEFRSLWEAQAPAVRGGFQITTPLGKPVKRLTVGGQSPIGDFISQKSAKLAASRPGLFLTGGRDRELLQRAKVLGQQIDTPGGLARAAQAETALRAAQAERQLSSKLIRKLSPQAKSIYASVERSTNAMSKEVDELTGENLGELVVQDMKRWYGNDLDGPDEVRTLLLDADVEKAKAAAGAIAAGAARTAYTAARTAYENGTPLETVLEGIKDRRLASQVGRWYNLIETDTTGRLLGGPLNEVAEAAAKQAERVAVDAFAMTRTMRDLMYDKYKWLGDELGEDFSDVGIVDGALRDITKDARDLERDMFGVGTAKTGSGKQKSRASFFSLREDGTPKWFSLEQANEAQRANYRNLLEEEVAAGRIARDSEQYNNFANRIEGLDWFETDPRKVFASRINRLERQVHKATAVKLFKAAGLLVEAEADRGLKPKGILKAARAEIDRLAEETEQFGARITDLTRIRPGAPSGETAQLAEGLAARAEQVGGQFFTPVQPVIDLGTEARRVAESAASDDGTITRSINRVQNDIDVLHERVKESAADATKLRTVIASLNDLEGEDQTDAFAALLDTVIDMKKEQAERLAARTGVTEEVKELRSVANKLIEAKNRQATAVINLTARAEPMTRLGKATDPRGFLIPVENQLADLWAPELLSTALANSYKVVNESKTVVEKALRETTGIWKQWATFGRGPAFVFRNIGGWWNAFLVGANGGDFKEGLRYATQYELAQRDIRKAMQNVKPGDIDKAVDLVENAFRERMSGRAFGVFNGKDGNDMYRAHQMMESEGIFGGTITGAAMDVDVASGMPRSIRGSEVVGRGRQQILVGPQDQPSAFERVRTGQLTVGEAATQLRRQGVAETAKQAGKGALRASINNPYMYVMRAMSEDSERFLRASTFGSGLRQYGEDAAGSSMASMMVKASQFDYTDLSPSEQRVMKLISPFFIWTKNNVPYQFRNLLANPGKVNAILKLQENVKNQFGEDTEDMEQYIPSWLSAQLGFASSFKSGENQLAMSLNLPLTDLNRMFQVPVTESGNLRVSNPIGTASSILRAAIGGSQDQALTSLNPFIKAPIEAVTGTNLFTGAKFSDQTAGPAYRSLSWIPGLPDTYTDAETGEVRASGFAINQFRNLLPQLGQLDRLLPMQQGSAAERLRGNWISQGLSFLPVTVSATLTPSQYAGELRTRNLAIESQIRDYERANGLVEGSIREQYNESQKVLSAKSRSRALAAALAP
jgi:hypothetical protein